MIIRLASPPEITGTGAVLWNVPAQVLPEFPAAVSFRDIAFTLKPEFHLTVFGKAETRPFSGPGGAALLESWGEAWLSLDDRIQLPDEVWLLRKYAADSSPDHSLAIACLAPAVSAGRQLLSALTGVEFPERPSHITIYYEKDPDGIAVASEQALSERRMESGSWATFGLPVNRA